MPDALDDAIHEQPPAQHRDLDLVERRTSHEAIEPAAVDAVERYRSGRLWHAIELSAELNDVVTEIAGLHQNGRIAELGPRITRGPMPEFGRARAGSCAAASYGCRA